MESQIKCQICTEIVSLGRALLDKGLVSGTWGNISARIPDTNLIAITPSGRNYYHLTPSDIVLVETNGSKIEGDWEPSSELPLHLAIYKTRADVQAIVHTHSVYASACAVAHKAIPPVIEDVIQVVGGSVDVAQYALPGTAVLATYAVTALQNKNAVLLANHGVIGCGQSLTEALLACELVEKAAHIYILASGLGGAFTLDEQDVDSMHQFYSQQYRHRKGGLNIDDKDFIEKR